MNVNVSPICRFLDGRSKTIFIDETQPVRSHSSEPCSHLFCISHFNVKCCKLELSTSEYISIHHVRCVGCILKYVYLEDNIPYPPHSMTSFVHIGELYIVRILDYDCCIVHKAT